MNPYNLSILCFGFCSFLLGLLVWLKRQDVIGKRYFLMAIETVLYSRTAQIVIIRACHPRNLLSGIQRIVSTVWMPD